VSPLRGEKPQNRPLSKLNTGRLALRALAAGKDNWAEVLIGVKAIGLKRKISKKIANCTHKS